MLKISVSVYRGIAFRLFFIVYEYRGSIVVVLCTVIEEREYVYIYLFIYLFNVDIFLVFFHSKIGFLWCFYDSAESEKEGCWNVMPQDP